MVSLGPTHQSTDMRHMYDLPDICPVGIKHSQYPTGSLMDIISTHPDFTIYYAVAVRSNMTKLLSDPTTDLTLLVPSDEAIVGHNGPVDIGAARQIIRRSMIRRRVTRSLLQSSPSMTIPVIDRSTTLTVLTGADGTSSIDGSKVLHWNHPATNGLIHVVNGCIGTG